MENDSSLEKSIDFVGRQLVYLIQEQQLNTEDALQLIRTEASDEVSTAVAIFEGILSGDKPNLDKGSPLHTFVDNVYDRDRSPQSAGIQLTKFIKLHKEYSQIVKTYLLSLKNTLAYSGALIAIAFVISLIYSVYVLSGINSFFTEYGGELPAFTEYMMSGGMYVVYAVLAIGALFVISLSITIMLTLKNAEAFKPVSSFMTRFYISRGITSSFNRYLLLNYIDLFLDDDVADDKAIDKAVDIVNGFSSKATSPMQNSGFIDELRFVSRLGTLGSEIEYLLENVSNDLQYQIINFRSKLNIGFQIAIFLAIGALVVAYYLPLFNIGTII